MSAPKKISIVYLAFFLCVICAVATAALAFVANTTAAPIAKAKEALGKKLTGTIRKEIYVPGRIVNIVAK